MRYPVFSIRVAVCAAYHFALPADAGGAAPIRDEPERVAFIDAHAHLGDVGMQLGLMDELGVERAVIFWGRRSDNQTLLEAARRHPDRFIPFASVSPERRAYRPFWINDDTRLLDQLGELLDTGGFKGIGELSLVHFPARGFPEADFSPTSRLAHGVLELANRHGVPVVIHCEMTRLAEFSALLEAHPEVDIIWAHGGYTPLVIARRMLERHANLHYELSARTWARNPRSPEFSIAQGEGGGDRGVGGAVWPEWLDLIERFPSRFIVGTDSANNSRDADAGKIESVHAFLAQLTPETRRLVGRENLLKLIGER